MKLMSSMPTPTVNVTCCPEAIVCSWISPQQIKNKPPYILNAYQRTPISPFVLRDGKLFNPTLVGQIIRDFIQHHKLHNPFVAITLSEPTLQEKLITRPTNAHQPHQVHPAKEPNPLTGTWQEQHLYPKDAHNQVYYTCLIPPTLQLQFQLMAIQSSLNLTIITTPNMTLLNAYQHLCGTAYSYGRMAQDLEQHATNLMGLFNNDMLYRYLSIPPQKTTRLADEAPFLWYSLGLSID